MRQWACTMATGILLASASVAAQPAAPQEPRDAAKSISGTWIMLLSGHQVGLELEDESGRLQGTLHIMGQRVLVDGTIEKGTFTLASEAQIGDTQSHGATVRLSIKGTHNSDDTLEGEIHLPRGPMSWTAERLKPPRE